MSSSRTACVIKAENQHIIKLSQEFYMRDSFDVAQDLIGCFLVRKVPEGIIAGRINEVEAYRGVEDKGSHAYGERRTPRTQPLYAQGGIAYIHLIYGMYYCFNAVTNFEGNPQSVLIRGLEIYEGKDRAAQNRYRENFDDLRLAQKRNLSNGPGKLCMALQIDKSLNQIDLGGDTLFICEEIGAYHKEVGKIAASKRIGIDYAQEAKDFLWRFTG